MKILQALQAGELGGVREPVDLFAEEITAPYLVELTTQLRCDPQSARPKDIHDAVWGTIHFNRGEVLVLDSPAIQRLRRIRHLGLAGLLFPGAGYSRFEHTLGVVYVADRIAKSIIKDVKYKLVGDPDKHSADQLVRLAAMFHDVGHMFASHASERYFESPWFSGRQIIDTATNYLIRTLKVPHVKFGELLSALLVVSPATKKLISIVWPYLDLPSLKSDKELTDLTGQIAALILGVPTTYAMLPFCQIINGSIDADKCDYLARDSHQTGVPVAVDLYRVIQKLRVIKTVPAAFSGVWEEVTTEPDNCLVLGIDLAAVKSVEEILISRTLMHEKIYFHHKILTAEQMLREAVRLLDQGQSPIIRDLRQALRATDSDIISCHPEMYFEWVEKQIGFHSTENGSPYRSTAIDILRRISNRRLFKRACALNLDLLVPTADAKKASDFLRDIFENVDPSEQRQFLELVQHDVNTISGMLDADSLRTNSAHPCMAVSCPPAIASDLNIYVDFGEKPKTYREIFQSEVWDNSRKIRQKSHFVASEPNLREYTFIAVEKVLFTKYFLLLRQDAIQFSRLNYRSVLESKARLVKMGYYKDALGLLPNPSWLIPGLEEKIKSFVVNWRAYEGPGGYSIGDPRQVIAYLNQFTYQDGDMADLFHGIINLLSKTRILGRSDISVFFSEVVRRMRQSYDLNDIRFVVLGNLQDSSAHIAYFMNDVNKNLGTRIRVMSLGDALGDIESSGRKSKIVFLDDAFHSGTQVVGIFQEFMGVPVNDRLSKEEHGVVLSAAQRELLKNIECCLCFCFGKRDNTNFIEENIKKLGLNIHIELHMDFDKPVFEATRNDVFDNESQRNRVKSVFERIGAQLLASNRREDGGDWKPGWNEKRVKDSALGYADAQQCLATAWNTPAYTLTALWCSGGLEDGTSWRPLFPRQSKSV